MPAAFWLAANRLYTPLLRDEDARTASRAVSRNARFARSLFLNSCWFCWFAHLWVANSQCDAVRTRRAVLHVPAVMVRFARCETSSSSSSTCWSPLRSSFAPVASAPWPPSACYSAPVADQ
jgi:hypothetical protein